jgi:hypothetical protein
VHQQPLARRQPGLGEQRVVGGREHLGEASGRGPVQGLGDRHRHALVHHRQLGLSAAGDERHHAVALGEARGAGAALGHLAGQLHPGDVGWRARRRGVAAGPLVDVAPVEPGGPHADQDLARAGPGIGVLGEDHLAVADGGGAHGGAILPGPSGRRRKLRVSAD